MGKFDLPTRHGMTAPFRSKEAFLDFVKAPQGNEGHGTVGDPRGSNKDLEPTPEEHRTWTWYNSSDRLQRELTN
jgi:NCS1 family nucleobase:cation symporter-1